MKKMVATVHFLKGQNVGFLHDAPRIHVAG